VKKKKDVMQNHSMGNQISEKFIRKLIRITLEGLLFLFFGIEKLKQS